MKNEELYSRILQHRTSKKGRHIIPYLSFYDKTSRSERLLSQIERKIKDRRSLKEALIQSIISDITAFEVYFKDLIHVSFEYYGDEEEFLTKCQKLVDRKFEFQDLITIYCKQIELSEIIAEFQNFQNLGSIDKVFSAIIKDNFLDSLNGREFQIGKEKEPFKLEDGWYEKLQKYLLLRHDLTHDYNPKLKLKRDEIDELRINLNDFVIAVDVVFQEEIEEKARSSVTESKKETVKS